MSRRRLAANIFSNWTGVAVMMAIQFVTTPIIVRGLGHELYGVWNLVVEVTGWFTVLDLGVSTAIVRFVSRFEAEGDRRQASAVYSTALVIFTGMAGIALVATLVLAPLVAGGAEVSQTPRSLVAAVLVIVGCEVALGLILSVFQSTLKAQHEFVRVNAIQIVVRILRNTLIVILLLNGFSILSMALAGIGMTALRLVLLYLPVSRRFRFRREDLQPALFREFAGYSVYSFMISIVQKALFNTYALVVTMLLHAREVVFIAMPMMVLYMTERVIYGMMSVLTPIISSQDALKKGNANRRLYLLGTRYSTLLIFPMIYALYNHGADFIRIWQSEEIGARSEPLLKILCVGFVFYLLQLISNSVLKGISRHKVYAWMFLGAAVTTVVCSVSFVGTYGLEAVALSTAIPLGVTSFLLVPVYTCRVLGVSYGRWLGSSLIRPLALLVPLLLLEVVWDHRFTTYAGFLLYCALVQGYFLSLGAAVVLEPGHRRLLLARLRPDGS